MKDNLSWFERPSNFDWFMKEVTGKFQPEDRDGSAEGDHV